MGFFDKVKNMFTEEVEDDEVKVQQIKKEVTHVPIESPVKDEKSIDNEFNFNQGMNFSKPIFFDEDDFEDLDLIEKKEKPKKKEEPKKEKIEPKIEEKQIYSGNSVVEKTETKIFKPTPIISPVYGILDKNYHKEDIIDRTITNDTFPKEDKIDIVREKAYGTLEDELENTLFGNSILFKKDEESEDDEVEFEEIDGDSISSLTDDVGKELDELLENKKKRGLLKEKKHKEKKEDKEEVEEDEDLLGFIDSTLYKDGDEE